jgi:hypothetical protein
LEQAANQFELHRRLAGHRLHLALFTDIPKWPVGFFWYHLRTGKYYFTYRTEKDFETLIMQVRYIIDSLNEGLFPKFRDSIVNTVTFLSCAQGLTGIVLFWLPNRRRYSKSLRSSRRRVRIKWSTANSCVFRRKSLRPRGLKRTNRMRRAWPRDQTG